MTPKQKAKKLVEKFIPKFSYWDYYNDNSRDINLITKDAKEVALIAVDEIIKSNPTTVHGVSDFRTNIYYWEAVKQEIEKL